MNPLDVDLHVQIMNVYLPLNKAADIVLQIAENVIT